MSGPYDLILPSLVKDHNDILIKYAGDSFLTYCEGRDDKEKCLKEMLYEIEDVFEKIDDEDASTKKNYKSRIEKTFNIKNTTPQKGNNAEIIKIKSNLHRFKNQPTSEMRRKQLLPMFYSNEIESDRHSRYEKAKDRYADAIRKQLETMKKKLRVPYQKIFRAHGILRDKREKEEEEERSLKSPAPPRQWRQAHPSRPREETLQHTAQQKVKMHPY